MKHTPPVRHTLRFRRWSRKAYAAFASIGRCVTIGCLRKSVADSSLSKQKAAGSAGHASCCEESAWESAAKAMEKEKEKQKQTEQETILKMLREALVIRPRVQQRYILKPENKTSTDYQELSSTFIRLLHPDNPCFFL